MKVSELKKDKQTTIRINKEVEQILKEKGFESVQKFLNAMIDQRIALEEFLKNHSKNKGV